MGKIKLVSTISICGFFVLAADACLGFITEEADSNTTNLYLDEARPIHREIITVAPQLMQNDLQLVNNLKWIGQKNVDPAAIVKDLAPNLALADISLIHRFEGLERVRHDRYQLYLGDMEIHEAIFTIHFLDDTITMVQGNFPKSSFTSRVAQGRGEWLSGEDISERELYNNLLTLTNPEFVWLPMGDIFVPAIRFNSQDKELHSEFLYYHAVTGELLFRQESEFKIAQAKVFEKNSYEAAPQLRTLAEQNGKGHLDGKYLQVFGGDQQATRAFDKSNVFNFSPEHSGDFFDQSQSYYSAMRGLEWFRTRFNYESPQILTVYTNHTIKNNAKYVPHPINPTILLGRGAFGKMSNLSRDSDVIIHELSHHVIFSYITNSEGESLIIHEGTADYFTYAINGDPNLAETVIAGKPYVRTADLSSDEVFDNPNNSQSVHFLGSIWAAMLWDLRKELGPVMDDITFAALPYMGTIASMRSAILALFVADRDLFALAGTDPEYGVFGRHKCLIISTALSRGFASQLADIDGTSCGIKLKEEAEKRERTVNQDEKGRGKPLRLMGLNCGTISLGTATTPKLLSLILLALPVVLIMVGAGGKRRMRRGRDGS